MKNNGKYERYSLVKESTGEVVIQQGFDECYEDDLIINVSLSYKEYLKRKNIGYFNEYNKKLGGFYLMYINKDILFGDIDIKNTDIPKLLYLASYLDYNDRNNNLLCKKSNTGFIEPMSRKEVSELLGYNETKAGYKWIKSMEKLNLIQITDEGVLLSDKYFKKGKEKNHNRFIKMYVKTIRELYRNNNMRKHKQLGYIFRLFPFIHINTNILCWNSDDVHVSINPLSKKDVANLLGISESNMYKLFKDLLSIRLDFNEYNVQVLKYITVSDSNDSLEYFVINPLFAYRGTVFKELEKTLKDYFFIKENDIIKK